MFIIFEYNWILFLYKTVYIYVYGYGANTANNCSSLLVHKLAHAH